MRLPHTVKFGFPCARPDGGGLVAFLVSKSGSDDPLLDASSPGKGPAEGNGEATAPAGEQDAQQTLALAEKAEKKEEAEKQHNKENAPMQEAEEIAPNAVGQLYQEVQFFDDDKKVWLAVDPELNQLITDSLSASDPPENIWYYRRDGKDKYWIDLKDWEQTNCNARNGGRTRWLRMVQRVVVLADANNMIAGQYDATGVEVSYSDFNWQYKSNSGWENVPHPMNEKMLALVTSYDLPNGIHECTHKWKHPITNRVTQTVYSIDLGKLLQTNPDSQTIRQIRLVYDSPVHEGGPQPKLPCYPEFGDQPSDSEAIGSQPSAPEEVHSVHPPKGSWDKQSGSWNTKGWPQPWSSKQKERDVWDGHDEPSTQGSKHDDQGS